MRNRLFVFGATVLVCVAVTAQTDTSEKSGEIQSHKSDVQSRETGSGMATGKKASGTTQLQSQGVVHRDLAAREKSKTETSGDPHEYVNGREAASGMATGKRQHTPITDTDGDVQAEKHKNAMSGAQSNPMYNDDGKSGTNPMYEGNQKVQSGLAQTGSALASGAAVVKTKTKSNQSNDRVAAGDGSGDGSTNQWPSQQKTTINTSRSNIKNQKSAVHEEKREGPAPAQPKPPQAGGPQ